ncbi:MAG: T9SS type A sorting domain-containing protein, partial [Bacteroidales bacterium]
KDFVMGPNPFSESIILRFRNSSGTEQLEIFNLNGKQVMETTISSNPFELDMASLRDGPYVMVIQGPYGNYSEKIVKLSREL